MISLKTSAIGLTVLLVSISPVRAEESTVVGKVRNPRFDFMEQSTFDLVEYSPATSVSTCLQSDGTLRLTFEDPAITTVLMNLAADSKKAARVRIDHSKRIGRQRYCVAKSVEAVEGSR